MVVELIGPVVDDGGAVASTLAHVLTREGVDLRPGALDQVAGMGPEHALRTLAEGHGRFELLDTLETLVARHAPALEAWAMAGSAQVVTGALNTWQRLGEAGSHRAVLTTLPALAARQLASRLGIVVAPDEWIVADDSRGPPHPDHLARHLAGRDGAMEAIALVQSVGAALAAASAGCRVVAVGAGSGASMFADQQIAAIQDFS